MKGIYQYKDLKNNEVIYIGKDSHIDKHIRHNDHIAPSSYDKQQINRVIQNNPDRYKYEIIQEHPNLTDDELNWLECMEIMKHKFLYGKIPKFNFTIGGEGSSGYKHTKEAKQKIRESKIGVPLSEEHKQKICVSLTDKNKSEDHKQKISKSLTGKKKSEEHKENLSKSRNSVGFYRVCKKPNKSCKQGYTYHYTYFEENKQKAITSISLKKLEKKVKARGLKWIKIEGE